MPQISRFSSTHWPFWQVALPPHVPHEPPQPLSPHSLPEQFGEQVVVQAPFWQVSLPLQSPQVPPQPFGPHSLPLHCGTQLPVVHWPFWQDSPAAHSAVVQQLALGMHFLPHFFVLPLHFFFFLCFPFFFLAAASASPSREPTIPPSPKLKTERRDGTLSERTNWSKRSASIDGSSANAELAAADHRG
jgi:hypothetical protein